MEPVAAIIAHDLSPIATPDDQHNVVDAGESIRARLIEMNANARVLWVLSEILPEVTQRFKKSLKGSLIDELDRPSRTYLTLRVACCQVLR